MSNDVGNNGVDNVPKSPKVWVVLITAALGAIITASASIVVEAMKENHEIIMYETQNDDKQYFNIKAELVQKVGIDYKKYELSSNPVVQGYHAIVYPYVICRTKDREAYIPITGQFSQSEYVADENGICYLMRENTSEELEKTILGMEDFAVDVKCLLAIRYVEKEKIIREVYYVSDGQLVKAEEKTAIEILRACEDKNTQKIDMLGWPSYDQQVLRTILDKFLKE